MKAEEDPELISPCGMNCAICSGYLAYKNDVKNKGVRLPYCIGCRPRNKKCAFLKKHCSKLANDEVTFCFECSSFPCDRLRTIDSRYRSRYRMSMIENLNFIKENGIEQFLDSQEKSWKCRSCGELVCCHNGICFNCSLEKLRNKKQKYRWDEWTKIIRTETRRYRGWCCRLLEGKNVNLRVVENEDLPLVAEWENNLGFIGEYDPLRQLSKGEIEKNYDKLGSEEKWFFIEKKDGSKIGFIGHSSVRGYWEIGYVLIPSERGKGYCAEAVQLMVDYLFLSKDTVRIQAGTHVENIASQKVLERTGFKREGLMRKEMFTWGKWDDGYLYSILREEWKEPKILTRAEK